MENLKARHCSHCFQYYFSQLLLAFFGVLFQPGLLVILSPGSARAPHVHLVRPPCALAVNKLTATPAADPVAPVVPFKRYPAKNPTFSLLTLCAMV